MIKANELRIGNWINYKDEPIMVTLIGDRGVQSDNPERTINAKFSTPDLSPIPLTPQVLEKCGFLGDDSQNGYHRPYMMQLKNKGDYQHWKCEGMDGYAPVLDYLHQLQNLYFALTGNELEYKQ